MSYHSRSSLRLRSLGLALLTLGLLGLSLAGCVRLLEPRKSDATYYLLAGPQDGQPPSDTTGLAVGLRQPRMAPYLAATRIVTRRGPHEVGFSEFHRWAEDLNRGINRTVALTLAKRSGIRQVETVPWPQAASFDYVVQLEVLAFEGVGPPIDPEADPDAPAPEGHSQMTVQWTILDASGDSILARGRTEDRREEWPVGDYEALTDHLSRSLSVLADDLGTRLEALSRQ